MANKSDDFEFKPLSEGLGFHKKVIDIKEKPESTPAPARQEVRTPIFTEPSLGRSYDFKSETKPVASKVVARPQAIVVGGGTKTVETHLNLKPIPTSWPAAIFDSTMVLGLVLIFSAIIFAITRIDFAELFQMLQNDGAAQWGSFVLVFAVYEIYTVACRTFFGKTVGESVFECQLGDAQDQSKIFFPLQVAWRSFVIALTGFVVLPLLSSLLKEDLAGILSGVNLYADKQ